jgi:hypothetical protein
MPWFTREHRRHHSRRRASDDQEAAIRSRARGPLLSVVDSENVARHGAARAGIHPGMLLAECVQVPDPLLDGNVAMPMSTQSSTTPTS